MKAFLSADIEGTAGIAHWDETEHGKFLYEHFARQMTREVASACEGAIAAGCDEILIKDAHDSARNIDPDALPECARIFRGWGREPYSMMAGLDNTYNGVIFTGYHSAAGTNFNPLSHTMNLGVLSVKINGEIASELMINCLTAACENVPVRFVSGDKGLCDWISGINPNIKTLAVSQGVGNGSISIQPALATRLIRERVKESFEMDGADLMFPLPESFVVEVEYRQHYDAKRAGFYPGALQTGPRSVCFQADKYIDVLTFFSFTL